ncbi:unnamed protein product [Mycena citricolor]|uniref:Uncharacterized protein n=1 Tax=Mycena citricolor TaxID=2018698 RepID=A0AAD2HTU5_9AGAR|nr:unnamed protein product [Mycena citricolor]
MSRSSSPFSERKSTTRLADPPRTPRVSVFSSVVPYLRRTEIFEEVAHNKTPRVTLKLSSVSFLDSTVKDDVSQNPLYVIRTSGTSTSILRSDPWDGLNKTAEIKWPRQIPTKDKTRATLGVLVQLSDGRWQSGDAILKPGTMLSAPSKFTIPDFGGSMKWKRMGNAYWCTTSSVKGPIATLHPAFEGVPPRLRIFETLHDRYDARPVPMHQGVSILLIDHLILTALLLVTDVQDWMLVQKYQGPGAEASPAGTSSSDLLAEQAPLSAPVSTSQWRKVFYGEPIFPKRYPSPRNASTPDLSAPVPTSSKQMAKIIYGDPLFPSISPNPDTSTWAADDDDSDDDTWARQRDSAMASPVLPQTPPNQTDTIFTPRQDYRKPDAPPPVPRIPTHFANESTSTSRSSSSREAPTPIDAPTSRASRQLPTPLKGRAPHRSQSTPPREPLAALYGRRPSEPLFLAMPPAPPGPSEPSPATPSRTLVRSQSMRLRQLPLPPSEPSTPITPSVAGRTSRRGSQYSQRSLPVPPGSPMGAPPLPPLPPLPQPKDPSDPMWFFSAAGPRASQFVEAPPPYLESSPDPMAHYHKARAGSATVPADS